MNLTLAKLLVGINVGMVLEIVCCSLCPVLIHYVLEKVLYWSEVSHGSHAYLHIAH